MVQRRVFLVSGLSQFSIRLDEILICSIWMYADRGEGVMLTGDENIVNVNFEVQWRVKDAKDYLFKVRDYKPGFSVKNAAESAMREIIGKNTISFALLSRHLNIIHNIVSPQDLAQLPVMQEQLLLKNDKNSASTEIFTTS